MAKPATKQQLIDYCFRKLGAPVLEINVDDDQVDDLVDDAIQLFNERHFDGVERMYLKYEITQGDIDRGVGAKIAGESAIDGKNGIGIVTTTTTSTSIPGYGTTTTTFYENSNFLQIPDPTLSPIGIIGPSRPPLPPAPRVRAVINIRRMASRNVGLLYRSWICSAPD